MKSRLADGSDVLGPDRCCEILLPVAPPLPANLHVAILHVASHKTPDLCPGTLHGKCRSVENRPFGRGFPERREKFPQ